MDPSKQSWYHFFSRDVTSYTDTYSIYTYCEKYAVQFFFLGHPVYTQRDGRREPGVPLSHETRSKVTQCALISFFSSLRAKIFDLLSNLTSLLPSVFILCGLIISNGLCCLKLLIDILHSVSREFIKKNAYSYTTKKDMTSSYSSLTLIQPLQFRLKFLTI